MPRTRRGNGAAAKGSSGEMLHKKAATAASSGGAPTMDPGKGPSGSDSGGEMLQKKAAAAASSGGSAALGALHRNSTAQDREESDAKHRTTKPRTISSAKIPHEHCTEDEANMGLSGGMLQKQTPKVEADTGLSGGMLHEHLAEEADTAKGIKESDSNEIVHAKEEDTRIQEVEDLIKMMNASCIGEQISSDEFLAHYERLARNPPWNDLDDKMEYEDMDKQEVLHALYRFRYLKYQCPCQTSKEELLDDKLKSLLDKSEDDFNQEFLEEEEFFRRFEIWRRVTQKSISFEDALEEVYKMNMFPLRQHRMEAASKGGARAATHIRLLPDSGSLSWPRSGPQVCATAENMPGFI